MTAMLMVLVSAAFAVDVTFCADYRVSYSDDGDIGDDIFNNQTAGWYTPARGARIKVIEDSTSNVVCQGYANDDAPDLGCLECAGASGLDALETYTVKILAKAQVNGHTFKVVDANGDLFVNDALSGWTPTAGTKDISTTVVHDAWRISAVAGWAFQRADGGGTPPSDPWVFWRADVCFGGTTPGMACAMGNQEIGLAPAYQDDVNGDGIIDDVPSRANSKYTIAHEIGHALGIERDEDGFTNGLSSNEYDLDPGDCYTHFSDGSLWELNALEYQSSAAVEGFADFYAALTFNEHAANDDCFYRPPNKLDWDLNGNFVEHSFFPSCDLGPYPSGVDQSTPLAIGYFDYLGWTTTELGYVCVVGGSTTNRATIYDYTRFFWDLHTGSQGCSTSGVSFDTLLDVWDSADPRSWNADDSGFVWDQPKQRLRVAANIHSVLSNWLSCDYLHGIDG